MRDLTPTPARFARFFAAAAAGPATAILHEFDLVPIGPPGTLWPLVVIVLASMLGIFFGLRFGQQNFRRLRWLAMMPNGLVLCFYGFFLLFFGLGGSR